MVEIHVVWHRQYDDGNRGPVLIRAFHNRDRAEDLIDMIKRVEPDGMLGIAAILLDERE